MAGGAAGKRTPRQRVKYSRVFTTVGLREGGRGRPIRFPAGTLRKSKNHEEREGEGGGDGGSTHGLPRRIYRGEIRRFIEAVRGS